MKHIKKICLVFIMMVIGLSANAQSNVAIKTNFVPDALLSPNIGVEVGLAPQWTLDISGEVNLWPINNKKWKHWMVQPEARFWFCDRFAGQFIGLHLMGGQYSFGNIRNHFNFLGSDFSPLTDHRVEGWGAGLGVGYGYSLILSDHFNLEFEIGVGAVYTRFNTFETPDSFEKIEENAQHFYYGPTKVSIALEYVF